MTAQTLLSNTQLNLIVNPKTPVPYNTLTVMGITIIHRPTTLATTKNRQSTTLP